MRGRIIENLRARFDAYNDLIAELGDEDLETRINAPKHKSLKEHLWCVVGARESYAKALEAGEWGGFTCSMTSFSASDFKYALKESSDKALSIIDSLPQWSDAQDDLLASLSEHEVMHEGQIIRHIYGVEGTLPSSWKWA